MSYVNVTLIGNVGRDPELRFTPSGAAVCEFSLATNRRWTDRSSNEKREETTWWRVTVWGQQAESVNQYVSKGRQVLVVADRVEASAYMGQDGQPRASLEVTARTVQFLSGSGGGGDYEGGGGGGNYNNEYSNAPNDVDDIPF